ncbi:MAG: hypothetical protein ACKOGD_05095 [Sphingomonadales bacterium]
MISAMRAAFNEQFTEAKYLAYLAILNEPFKNPIPFRIAETPVFIDRFFKAQLMDAGDYTCEFISKPSFQSKTINALPKELHIPNEASLPECIVIDFAIAEGQDGKIIPQLIESVQRFQGKDYIFIQTATNVFEAIEIQVNQSNAAFVTVSNADVNAWIGKQIVVKNAYSLLGKLMNKSE